MYARHIVVATSFFIALLCTGCASSNSKDGPKRLSARQVEQMEEEAALGREAFGRGDYQASISCFEKLSSEFNTSQPLYLCELGSASLASGDKELAFKNFSKAYHLLQFFYDSRSEKNAASLWGAESEKVYKGDPYERCMLSLFIGSLFLERNDFDNALACFKNGQLADGDVSNELYNSDFGLLQVLESKCYELRSQYGMAEDSLEAAVNSFVVTHPSARVIVAEKQGLLNAVAEHRGSGKRLGRKKAQQIAGLESRIQVLNSAVTELYDKIDLDYLEPFVTEYNTLLLVWSGNAPHKQRFGAYGERCAIVQSSGIKLRYEVRVNDTQWYDAIQGLCDVTFQASTRGGREMDDVLESQAQFKAAADSLGDQLLDASDDVGGSAGLVMIAAGLIVKAVSAATTVEADIRCWQSLPGSVHVVPLQLPSGTHHFSVHAYDKFLATDQWNFWGTVSPDKQVNIFWVMAPRTH